MRPTCPKCKNPMRRDPKTRWGCHSCPSLVWANQAWWDSISQRLPSTERELRELVQRVQIVTAPTVEELRERVLDIGGKWVPPSEEELRELNGEGLIAAAELREITAPMRGAWARRLAADFDKFDD
jgi:hypothetical protein